MVDPQFWHWYAVVPPVMLNLSAAATIFNGGTIAVRDISGVPQALDDPDLSFGMIKVIFRMNEGWRLIKPRRAIFSGRAARD
jgi:hypothetical protein